LGEDVYVVEADGGPAGEIRIGVNLSDKEARIGGVSVAPRSASFLNAGDGKRKEGWRGGD
jgi:hypothetical protein